MIDGKSVLAIIPARGGSKGIPRKNIKLLAGKPLIAWTIEEAKKSKYIDRLILSSEDEEIIAIAKEWGCEVPFIRPSALASDDATSISVILHTLNWFKKQNINFDILILLQPTSPLRLFNNIDESLKLFVDKPETQSLVSVKESKENPYWSKIDDGSGFLKNLINAENNFLRRQDLPKVYALNGAIYISKVKEFLFSQSFENSKTSYYIMDNYSSMDIDEMSDFKIAEILLSRNQ